MKSLEDNGGSDYNLVVYTPDEMQSWEDYNSISSYMKSPTRRVLTHLVLWKNAL